MITALHVSQRSELEAQQQQQQNKEAFSECGSWLTTTVKQKTPNNH